jgi:hypothetical protein
MKKWLVGVAALVGALVSVSESRATGWCCPSYCAPCVTYQHVQVQRTVCVPVWSTVKQQVTRCEYRTEARVQKVTRHRCVPVVKDVPYQYTVAVPASRVEKQTYHVCVPYTEKVETSYTVMVPKVVKHQAVRKLARWVPVVSKAHRCVDRGHWQDQVCSYTVCCGGCCCAPCYQTVCTTHKVWCPNIVQEEYDVHSQRCEYYDEPYTYDVTVCEPVVQKQLVDVCRYRTEARVRDITVHFCTYETRTASRKVTEYHTEAYEEAVTYHVCVPVQVVHEVDVRVCSYQQQCITETVCVPCYSHGCCGW